MSTSFGLGGDILRSSPLYDGSMDSAAPLRETYPSLEAGIRVAREVLPRLVVVGDVRGHLTLTSAADMKAMFVAGGARPDTEDGSRLLGHVPMMIGIRLAF